MLLEKHYPGLRIDESALRSGVLAVYGELVVRPRGGAKRHPVCIVYPEGTPFDYPLVTPLKELPRWDDRGGILSRPEPQFFDVRHQMPEGMLCLFQRETRSVSGGDVLTILDVLRRTEQWFKGHYTGHWPPDTAQSELESHFLPLTDILMEDAFFAPDLQGFGRMFFALDPRRQWEIDHQPTDLQRYELAPMILTCLTQEQGIIRSVDAREQLQRLYWWIGDEKWDATKLAASPNMAHAEGSYLRHGYWWSLPNEPQPFHDGKGLLALLDSLDPKGGGWDVISSQLGTDLSLRTVHIIGLKYPSRDGDSEWLVLALLESAPKTRGDALIIRSDAERRTSFEHARVVAMRVHRLQPAALRLRNTGVVDDSIAAKSVLLIGLGALGSSVGELLAKAGVGKFRLCDCDSLMTSNVTRHVGGITDFGKLKIKVVLARMLEINPYLNFGNEDLVSSSVTSSLARLAGLIGSVDLTVCTTADEGLESIVNQIAVIAQKPVLYGRSMRKADVGRVFLVRPRVDACKCCIADYRVDRQEGRWTPVDWIDVSESDEDVLLHECGRPVIASSAVDLSFTAGLVARVALDVLEGKEYEHNHWLWSKLPAPDIDPRLATGMCTFSGTIPRRPGCIACQEPAFEELILSDEAMATIISETESSPMCETGGVLIGFVDENNRAVALRATAPGPNAVRTPTIFERDVVFTQSEVDRGALELGERGMYIGEWHSHMNYSLEPSHLDVASLSGISSAPNYLTKCPAMLISGLDPNGTLVSRFGAWAFPVGGRFYSINYSTTSNADALSIKPKTDTSRRKCESQ